MKFRTIKFVCIFLIVFSAAAHAKENFSMVIQKGHSEDVRKTAFSPDGRFYCTSTETSGTKLWDIKTGTLIKDINTNDVLRWCGFFTPDSKGIVKYKTNELSIWDLAEDKPVKKAEVDLTDAGLISSIDCRFFAVLLNKKNSVVIYNTENLKEASTVQYAGDILTGRIGLDRDVIPLMKFSYDGKYLVSFIKIPSTTRMESDRKKAVIIWDASSGKQLRVYENAVLIDVSTAYNTVLINNFANKKGDYYNEDHLYEIYDLATGNLIKSVPVKGRCKEKNPNGREIITENLLTGFTADEKFFWIVSRVDTGKGIRLDDEYKIYDPVKSSSVPFIMNDNVRSYRFTPDGKYIERTMYNQNQPDWYEILNASDNSIINTFKLHRGIMVDIQFSRDGREFYSSEGNEIVVRKTEDLSIAKKICRNVDDIAGYSISSDGKQIITTAYLDPDNKTKIRIWNIESGSLLFERLLQNSVSGHRPTNVRFSEDGRYLTYTTVIYKKEEGYTDYLDAFEISILNAKNGNLIKTIKAKNDIHRSKQLGAEAAYMINDKKVIFAASSYIQMFEGDDFKNVKTVFRGDFNYPIPLRQTALFKNMKYMAVSELKGIRIIEIDTGKTLTQFATDQECPVLSLNNDGSVLAMYFYNWYGEVIANFNSISLIDTKTGKLIKVLSGHSSSIYDFVFSPDGKYGISASSDGSTRIWNIESGKSVALLENDNKDWLIFTNEGYFDSSKNGGSSVMMTSGIDSFGVDQFALKNNRPDLIFKSVGLGSPELIEHYYQQYLKRLRKSGFSESDLSSELHIPEAKITATKEDGKFITVDFLLSDSGYNLKKYNVFVNDVPIFGSYGKDISGKSKAISEKLELTSGKNKIEISCINEKGAESYRALTYAEYKVPAKGDLYYIGFGVSKYKDNTLNLKYADKDAKDLAGLYAGMKGKYNKVIIKTYLNEEVTVGNIKLAKELLKNAKPDDTFVLFIAGHGVHDNDSEATYYFLTYNAERNNLSGTCANFELIEDLLQGIAPRNKLFLMDTCESGEIEDAVESGFMTAANSRGIKARSARALSVTGKGPAKRSYLFQKDRYIYNDLSRRSGAIVFSSCKGGELSYESDKIQNGYFTKEIISAIKNKAADKNKDRTVTIDELREYVSQSVAKITGDLQHPTVDRDNLYQKFGFTVE